MTGLNPTVDVLVEVAVVVTTYDLEPLDAGFEVVIAPNPEAFEQMSDFVRDMHQKSGLLEALPDGLPLADAEAQVLEYILSFVPDAGVAPLAGNTIGTDRVFIHKDMPSVHSHLHYRNIDVSTIKELAKHWFPKAYFQSPGKDGGHRARADILESIRELDYYRHAVFAASPGPDTSSVKKVAQQIIETWAPRL